MFTGIIEDKAKIIKITNDKKNTVFILNSVLAKNFRVDESVAHNGVCLTVEQVDAVKNEYRVTAIPETLSKTMLVDAKEGDFLNLERALRADSRLDGHFVQGHVDCVANIKQINELEGSTEYEIEFSKENESLIIGRGSICINGISLTIARNDSKLHTFTVCIIPHTINRTNIAQLKKGDQVNLEFDVLGKYVEKLVSLRNSV